MQVRLLILTGLALVTTARAQQGPIDPSWVYTTPVHWKKTPYGIHERTASATVVVLYPEGGYLEVASGLTEYRDKSVTFSNGDGLLIRRGTWSRTDENAIRVTARDEFWDDEYLAHLPNAVGKAEQLRPGPDVIDTCALEGKSATHFASRIHCHRLILTPSRLSLALLKLEKLSLYEGSKTP